MKVYPKLMLRCPFEIVEVGGKTTAVSIGGGDFDYNGVIELKNESTRFMFEKLQEGISLPELIKTCMDKYNDSPVEEVGPIVIEFLDKLAAQQLIVADAEHGVAFEEDE